MIDKVGRRPWYTAAFFLAIIPLMSLSILGAKTATEVVVLASLSYAILQTISFSLYLYAAELYPTRLPVCHLSLSTLKKVVLPYSFAAVANVHDHKLSGYWFGILEIMLTQHDLIFFNQLLKVLEYSPLCQGLIERLNDCLNLLNTRQKTHRSCQLPIKRLVRLKLVKWLI
jgi:hypothetical protein